MTKRDVLLQAFHLADFRVYSPQRSNACRNSWWQMVTAGCPVLG
jgi:hypothetical protein